MNDDAKELAAELAIAGLVTYVAWTACVRLEMRWWWAIPVLIAVAAVAFISVRIVVVLTGIIVHRVRRRMGP
jgi:hypothetical protein